MALPDFQEQKGSLFLRSNQMNYGRVTLNSNWHQAREAEPKDYDLNTDDKRDLGIATYKRFGSSDNSFPKTTYQDLTDQLKLKDKFTEQETRKPMVNLETLDHAAIDRDLDVMKHGHGAVLPRHNPDYNKYYLDSTYRSDYKPFDPDYVPVPERPPDFEDKSAAYRKCISQFTDTTGHRRSGRNTWQDESGIYANTHYKREMYQPTNPIPPQIV